jgi:sigma-B regulation protein RsbU (phosphoserine phosphatase)
MSRDLAILEKLEKELSLKQLQIKSLLTITQAINDNIPAKGLFNMYKSFLSWEMAVSKMALYVRNDEGWECASAINYQEKEIDVEQVLQPHRRLYTIKATDQAPLSEFDILIPVFHKDSSIAYALIGGIREQEDLYNKIQFITTITNIIAVAIENKRLFKETIQRERLNKEMELASEVQKMLIPDELPKTDNFEMDSIYMPHFNVGGDYFDYIKYGEDRYAVLIADISGKGVSAALLMANFQATIRSLISQYRDLQTFVIALNEAVLRITKGQRFITFFIAEVDMTSKEVRYVNCGHFPPVIYDGKELVLLDEGTSILGIVEDLGEVEEGLIRLENNATMMLFTDGLIDLQNEEGDYFTEDKIEDFIRKHHALDSESYNRELLRELQNFKGTNAFPDDIAILTCKLRIK